ncbi:MAG TPA: ferrochelatase [Dongiaceae bacterium]|jgi:ferrochelatase|nr:ferrochelatase [Dongiaceae bacterium]
MTISVVLFTLGGPDRQESVEPFLFNLFNDPAIISLPWPFRPLLARFIARRRAPFARDIYAHLGGGSPLLANTLAQMEALQRVLGDPYRVRIGMRYWHPFIAEAAALVKRDKPDKIILLPLYPHYSTTTTGSSVREWHRAAAAAGIEAPTATICCYPLLEGFVETVARGARLRINAAQGQTGGAPLVVFTAHGLPERVIAKGDPYQVQIEATARAVADKLALAPDRWILTYQSRVGRLPWLKPATDEVLSNRPGEAIVVVPLSFVSDHSETLVELDIEYRKLALEKGAAGYWRAPVVAQDSHFIAGLADLIRTAPIGVSGLCRDGLCAACRCCPARSLAP